MNRRAQRLRVLTARAQLQLTVVVRAGDMACGRPLYHEIVERARTAGLAGATVSRGLQGFGATALLRSPRLAGLNGTEPVLIEIIDDDPAVRDFLPVLDELIGSGVVLLKNLTTIRVSQDMTHESATAAT